MDRTFKDLILLFFSLSISVRSSWVKKIYCKKKEKKQPQKRGYNNNTRFARENFSASNTF